MARRMFIALTGLATLPLGGCLAAAAVEVVAETVEAGVEITGAVVGTAVDIAIPDGDKKDKDGQKTQDDE